MGILYYARYLELFELGRTEWQRDEGLRYADMESEEGKMLPVVRAECDYITPLKFDDLAVIETTVHSWTATTLCFESQVFRGPGGELCARGLVQLGCVASDSFRPSRMPEKYLDLLGEQAPEKKGRRRQ
jgi:acyl-CoA thioester hydrolase